MYRYFLHRLDRIPKIRLICVDMCKEVIDMNQRNVSKQTEAHSPSMSIPTFLLPVPFFFFLLLRLHCSDQLNINDHTLQKACYQQMIKLTMYVIQTPHPPQKVCSSCSKFPQVQKISRKIVR